MVKRSISLNVIFAALADPTRRQILQGLKQGCAPVAQVREPFAVSAPAVSRHLRVLERAGLVRRRRLGRIHEIELAAEPLQAATDWLETYRQHWEASLEALALYLESGESKESPKSKSNTNSKHQPHKHK